VDAPASAFADGAGKACTSVFSRRVVSLIYAGWLPHDAGTARASRSYSYRMIGCPDGFTAKTEIPGLFNRQVLVAAIPGAVEARFEIDQHLTVHRQRNALGGVLAHDQPIRDSKRHERTRGRSDRPRSQCQLVRELLRLMAKSASLSHGRGGIQDLEAPHTARSPRYRGRTPRRGLSRARHLRPCGAATQAVLQRRPYR